MVLKSLLSKAIARYRARVMAFTHEAIKAKSVLKMPFEATHRTKMHQDVSN